MKRSVILINGRNSNKITKLRFKKLKFRKAVKVVEDVGKSNFTLYVWMLQVQDNWLKNWKIKQYNI